MKDVRMDKRVAGLYEMVLATVGSREEEGGKSVRLECRFKPVSRSYTIRLRNESPVAQHVTILLENWGQVIPQTWGGSHNMVCEPGYDGTWCLMDLAGGTRVGDAYAHSMRRMVALCIPAPGRKFKRLDRILKHALDNRDMVTITGFSFPYPDRTPVGDYEQEINDWICQRSQSLDTRHADAFCRSHFLTLASDLPRMAGQSTEAVALRQIVRSQRHAAHVANAMRTNNVTPPVDDAGASPFLTAVLEWLRARDSSMPWIDALAADNSEPGQRLLRVAVAIRDRAVPPTPPTE